MSDHTRLSIERYFLNIAALVATRSTCLHRRVGAVLVRDNHILATGYNGAPSGEPHCSEVGCSKPEHGVGMERCRAVHGEQNAIIQAARHGVSIEGATLYCTHSPCPICAAMLKNAGIGNIIYEEEYDSPIEELESLNESLFGNDLRKRCQSAEELAKELEAYNSFEARLKQRRSGADPGRRKG